MTPKALFILVLARAGYASPSPDQYARACAYVNLTKTELVALADWRFLYKVGTVTTTAATRDYALASDVSYPLHWWDSTNNTIIRIRNPEDIIQLDPDENFESNVRLVTITGRAIATGYWHVDLFPTPEASSDAIKYRYKATIADLTFDDDSTNMGILFPDWFRNALLWGGSALYKEEKENATAKEEWEKYTAVVKFGMQENGILSVVPDLRVGAPSRRLFNITARITPDA